MDQTQNNNVATTRTAWFTMVALYIITIVNELLPDEVDLPTWAAPVIVAVIIGFLYRLSLVLSQKFNWWGVVLFLINRNPGYTPRPAGEPQPDAVPAPNADRGQAPSGLIWLIVGILLILALVVWLARAL